MGCCATGVWCGERRFIIYHFEREGLTLTILQHARHKGSYSDGLNNL